MKKLYPLLLCLSFALSTKAQPRESDLVNNISTRAVDAIADKYKQLSETINKQSQKLLRRMQLQEAKFYHSLAEKDSAKALQLFAGTDTSYQRLQDKLNAPVDRNIAHHLTDYIANVDTLQTGIAFYGKIPGLPPERLEQLANASNQIQLFESKMQQANEIQAFIREREKILKEQLSQYGLGKQLLSVNKEVYYYQERLQEYKNIISDKKKLEERAIAAIRDLPAFKSFFQKNSYLSQIFRIPGNDAAVAGQPIEGLQTRAQVQELVQQRIGGALSSAGSGGSPEQLMQQQLQQAQVQVSQLKDKLNKLTGGNNDMTAPDFKPDNLHTKSFLQHIEYGLNFQTTGATNYLPVTTDIAVILGYRFTDKITAGIGVGYKLGLGRGWNHITLSNQGASLRSYIDMKLHGTFWITGGLEYQYLSAFENLQQIKNLDQWQHSALIGIMKKIPTGRKKEMKIQLLYDALSQTNKPTTQPIKFRIGYSL